MSANVRGESFVAAGEAKPRFRLGYRPVLDGLRGVSILAVMWVHGGLFWLGQGGFLGVDIFFVLSGFLITALLLQEWEQTERVNFRNFYIRRGLRLLPPLFVLVALCALQVALFPPREGTGEALKSILVALFYLSNWLPVYPPLFHTWSLGIEEQFYILWPFLLYAMLRLRLGARSILGALLFGVALIALHRASLWHGSTGREHLMVYTRLDARADALLVGCMAGVLITRGLVPVGRAWRLLIQTSAALGALLVAASLAVVASTSDFLYYGGFTAIAVAVAAVIISLFHAPLRAFHALLEQPVLRWFGRLSYGLYLWHLPVYFLYDQVAPPFPFRSYTLRLFLPFLIKFAASVAVAAASFYFIEQPALRLKRRFGAETKEAGTTREQRAGVTTATTAGATTATTKAATAAATAVPNE